MLKFMKESGKSSGNKQDRIAVWSQTTSYPGVPGLHSEVGRGAHARNSNADNELKSTVSAMESIHKKEIKKLDFSKKHVESSMVAYSEKMRRISTDKFVERLKFEQEEENSKRWTNITKLYDEAIKTVSSEINYTHAIDRVHSISFSYPRNPTPPKRKASQQERLASFVQTDDDIPSVESKCIEYKPELETAKRTRKRATVFAPHVLTQNCDKLPPINIRPDMNKSVELQDIILKEEIVRDSHDKSLSDLPRSSTPKKMSEVELPTIRTPRSSVVISSFPGLTEDEIQKFHIPSPEEYSPTDDGKSSDPPKAVRKSSKTTRKESRNGSHHDVRLASLLNNASKETTRIRKTSKDTRDKTISQEHPVGFNPHRRRSLSMPTSQRCHKHLKTKCLVDCEGNEIVLKSVLRHRKTSDITYMVKKSVQFQLPDLDKSHFDLYKHAKCEQSPNTITIIRTD
ncbi:uncharacterized protein LOC126817322 [Patella vulgata]|uniref:uncharacterized protein LOC126817322 n=1 Tax=Patella vulgata TaxID=6465 RepID=UPI00217FC0C4|nr:uncharacterized protein LOC126817322 [Patella vulgata]